MDNAIYVSLSRQIVLQRRMEIVANNVANIDTAGFKIEHLDVHTDPLEPSAGRQGPINYVSDTGVVRSFTQGAVEQTGNPYDLAISGAGFFSVQTAGGAGVAYTRDGHFGLDAQNQIVDKEGNPVLSTGGSPITVDPTRPAPTIGKDGVVSQIGPNAQVAQLGRIGVMSFANLGALTKVGANLYTADGVTPTAATDSSVSQGALEKSNVQGVTEIANLISIQRAYERMQDIISATQTISGKAIDSLGKLSS
jgi:flagellar basal-body rod protein FlgF